MKFWLKHFVRVSSSRVLAREVGKAALTRILRQPLLLNTMQMTTEINMSKGVSLQCFTCVRILGKLMDMEAMRYYEVTDKIHFSKIRKE